MSNFTITSGTTGLYILTPDDTLHVLSGGRSLDSLVGAKAVEYVSSGGDSSADHVLSGGSLVLSRGATAQGDVIDSGGVMRGRGLVTDGAHDYGLVAGVALRGNSATFGEDNFYDDGSERSVRVYDSATSFVQGRADGDRIFTGGVEHVASGGSSMDAAVFAGGSLVLAAGADAAGTILGAGATETAQASAVERDVKLHRGALLLGAETLQGASFDAGDVSGARIAFGSLAVASGGIVQAVHVAGHGEVSLARGAVADDLAVTPGGSLVDNGTLTYTGTVADALRGALSGSGVIAQAGSGTLVDAADGSAFRGEVEIRTGTVALETADGIGTGRVVFQPGLAAATLRLQGSGTPEAGAVFANALSGFDSRLDHLDLRNEAYVSGATATVRGSVLTLHDGAYTASFRLAGTHADAYAVSKDAAGGTVIRARGTSSDAIIQAAAGFDGGRGAIPGGHALASPTMMTADLAAVSPMKAHA